MIAKTKDTPSDAPATSTQLRTKIEKLEEERASSLTTLAGYEQEKAELIGRAYLQDDADARRRLEELNASIGIEQRRQQDIETAIAPLREDLASAEAREAEEAKAAELKRLEARIPKAFEAAERTLTAILEHARQLRPLIADHEAALATYQRARRRLSELIGDDPAAGGLGELATARVAKRVIAEAGLPEMADLDDQWREQGRAELREGAAYARGHGDGRRDGRREAEAELRATAATTPAIGPDGRLESAVDRRRREIFG